MTTSGNHHKQDLLRLSVSSLAMIVALAVVGKAEAQAPPVGDQAQSASTDEPPDDEADDEDDEESRDRVVVTGTNIRGTAPVGSETIVMDEEDIQAIGGATVADVVRTLPQVQRGSGNAQSFSSTPNNSTSATDIQGNAARGDAINLRGIGQDATLTLVNGRRISPAGTSVTFTEATQVPLGALQRVEVIADGASAIYGSDAIAGVVNFILRDDYEGLEATARYGANRYGDDYAYGLMGGTNWELGSLGKGNILFNYEFSRINPIRRNDIPRYAADQRPYGGRNNLINGTTATPTAAGNIVVPRPDLNGPFVPGGQTNNPNIPEAGTNNYFGLPFGANANAGDPAFIAAVLGRADQPNLMDAGVMQDFRGRTERTQVTLGIRQDIGANVELFVDARYTDRDTFTRTFFGGGNNGPATVNLTSTSPFYSNALATAVGLTPGAPIPIQYNLQAHLPAGFKFGNSTYDTQLSVTTGVDINLPADWHSEIAYTYANNDTCGFCYIDSFVSTDNADVNGVVFTPVIQRAINTGVINPLSSAPLTDSQFDFINGDNVQYAQSDSHDLTVRFDGPLIDLPGGKLRAAVGAEYQMLNHALQNGANRPPNNDFLWDANSNYDRDVYSAFAEFYVPVIGKQMNVPLVQSLALNAAARYDKYSDFGETTNPRVGFTWRVYDDLSFRGSWGTSYRAPDISRLQSGVFSAALIGIPISYTPAVLPLVTPPGFTDLFFPGSGQVSGLQIIGGNSELRAEEGENTSFGFDFEPGFVPGLRLSGTYYKINYDNQLGAPPVNLFFANAQNATTYGDFYTVIQPNQPGCNPADPSTYDPRVRQALIDALYDINIVGNACGVNVILDGRTSNTAGRVQEGLDFQADYVIDTDFGRFDFSGNINRILTSEFKASAITPTVDDLGGENGVNGPIEWRGRAGVNWSSGGWSVNLFGNYVGEFTINDVFQLVGQPAAGPRRVDSFITGDLNVNYSFDQAGNTGALSGLRVSLNVNNFTDEDPPIALTNGGSVNPNHDALGRVVRVSLTKAF